MRNSIFKRLAALVLCTALASFSALAASAYSKTIQVQYSGIKLVVDGSTVTPKDSKGNVVEPFTYNGTTYLPVRAVADALGKEVNWDSATQTVTLGGASVTYLDSLGIEEHTADVNKPQNATVSSASGQNYSHGILMSATGYAADGKSSRSQEITYALDGKYKTFSTTLIGVGYGGSTIKILGDGHQTLYTSPVIKFRSQDLDIDIDIAGQQRLYIQAQGANKSYQDADVVLNEARLIR